VGGRVRFRGTGDDEGVLVSGRLRVDSAPSGIVLRVDWGKGVDGGEARLGAARSGRRCGGRRERHAGSGESSRMKTDEQYGKRVFIAIH